MHRVVRQDVNADDGMIEEVGSIGGVMHTERKEQLVLVTKRLSVDGDASWEGLNRDQVMKIKQLGGSKNINRQATTDKTGV